MIRSEPTTVFTVTRPATPEGAGAVVIGRVVAEHPGMVTIRTIVGSERIVDMLVGEQLPRIC